MFFPDKAGKLLADFSHPGLECVAGLINWFLPNRVIKLFVRKYLSGCLARNASISNSILEKLPVSVPYVTGSGAGIF